MSAHAMPEPEFNRHNMNLQQCLADWHDAQGVLAVDDDPTLRRLKLATADFFHCWAEDAFATGWTAHELFGEALDCGADPCVGLVPMMAHGQIKADLIDLNSEGVRALMGEDLAAITGSADDPTIWLPKECFAIERAGLWWRHRSWTKGRPAGVELQ